MTNQEFPGFEHLLTFGEFGYSWSEMRIYRKDGRLFYLSDSGCSCYGWNDAGTMTEADMVELPTLESARNAYFDFTYDTWATDAGGEGWGDKAQVCWLDVKEKLRQAGLRR